MRTSTTIVSIAALSLALAACSGDNGTAGADSLSGEGTGEDCTIEAPIPIGAALSLTGGAASYGESQRNGLQLAVDHLNSGDGVAYDLTVEDDQTDPRQGITAFESLVADDHSIIIGPTLSNGAFQAQPIAQEAGVPVLAISNTTEGITEQGEYIFRNSLTEAQVIPQTVTTAVEAYDLEEVVVMYSDDDAFTEGGYAEFDAALDEQGVEVSNTLTFSVADTDFRALLTEARNADPDAIVVSGLIEAAIPLVTQARELGIDVPIIGGNGFNNPQLMADAGQAAEGVVVGAAWNSASDTPENIDFLEAYEAEFGHLPDQFAAQAYAAMTMIDVAVRENCSGERDDIRAGLNTVTDLSTVLGQVSIDDNRDTEHEAVVQLVDGGMFTVLD
ncbi:MAG TPA: ABC transporter substrate-binding protein [Beutenbergiaceae bacterium]|nr:ABC transporter substrate-binding protein [Beutenbergiaceae bacterium]